MIARKSLLIAISQFFARFLGWIGLVVLAKLWGEAAPEALGIIGFAIAFLAIFNFIADLGFSSAHVKRISEGKDLGTCIGTYAAIKVFLTGLMVIVIFTAIFIWKNVLHEGFYDATTESVIIVFVVYYVFSNLQIATATFEGRKEIAKREITKTFENIVKVPLMILVALAGVTSIGMMSVSPSEWPQFLQPLQQFLADHAVGSLAMTYVFGAISTFFIGIWFLRKYPLKKPSWELCKSYFFFALPVMLISTVSVISVNIDKIMIGYFWTSTEVGYYFTVQQILQIFSVITPSVGVVLFPTISEYHSSKNFQEIRRTTHLAERYLSMVMIPAMVVIIIFAHPFINIMLSGAFLPAASVLIVLTFYAFIRCLMTPYISLIRGINRPGAAAKIMFVMCATNISLNYLFIPEGGILSSFGINGPTGAAIATVLSALVGFFGLRIVAKKLTGITILQSHTPRHVIAGIVMGIVLYFLAFCTPFFPAVQWHHLFMFAVMGLAVYLGVLFMLKEFKKQDLLFFLNMLQPKKMLKYVSSELKDKEFSNKR